MGKELQRSVYLSIIMYMIIISYPINKYDLHLIYIYIYNYII